MGALDVAALLEGFPDGVLVADKDGRCVHANPAMLDLLRCGHDQVVGAGIGDLLPGVPSEGRARIGLPRYDGSTVQVEVVTAVSELRGQAHTVATVREISRRPWRQAVSAVQFTVAEILADASSPEEAAPRLLEALAEQLGWDTAEFWVVEEGRLRTSGVWATPELDLGEFERMTRQLTLGRGEPLPGSAWAEDAPVWIEDGLARMPFVRQAVATEQGLNAAFAVPIRHADEGILGALAFFARGRRPKDRELLRALEPLTAQVGHFLHRRRIEQALRESRDQLRAILGGVDDGITVQAPDGSLLFANTGAARAVGFDSPEDLVRTPLDEVMRRFEVLDEDGRPFPQERLPGRRALQGERNAGELVRFRITATGEERWSYVSASPVFDERGAVRFAINIFQDVTERKRADEGRRLLGEASAILASSLDYRTTLRSVADLAVSRLADWCVVYVQEEEGLRQLAAVHADPAMTPVVRRVQRRYPFEARSPAIAEVIRSGRSRLIPSVDHRMLREAAVDEEHFEALRGLGFRSVIVAPMRTADRTLGAIVVVSAGTGRRFGPDDLEMAEELGRRAAVAVDNAMVHEERAHVAETLQRSLLPPETPAVPGMEIATRYRPAVHDIAGDFYDVFPMGEGDWAVLIGDVCGKGAPAAALTAAARYTVHAAAIEHREPVAILGVLNEALIRQDVEGRFCTLLFATVRRERDGAALTLATGGHPPALILRHDGTVDISEARGMLLGVVPDPSIGQDAIRLGPGDAVVLYTDGLTDGGLIDVETVASELKRHAGQTSEEIAEAVESMIPRDHGQPRDDLAIVALRVTTE
jgi:PAS domain S-box-containing protein